MALRKPWAIITANHFVHVPMNKDVIDLLNEMASQDSRPISKNIIFRYHGSDLKGPSQLDDIDVKDSETDAIENHTTCTVKPDDTNIDLPIMPEEEEANPPDVHTSPQLPLRPVDFLGDPSGPDVDENQVPELLDNDNDSDDESEDENVEEAEVQDPEYDHYINETPPTPLVPSAIADDKTSASQGDLSIHTPPTSIPFSRPSGIRKAHLI